MAVKHQSATESATWTTTPDPFTFSHTPTGGLDPKGVVVIIYHGSVSTDLITSVSYGGVAMSRIVRATDTATEAGSAYLYFLGSGIPTGTQTVSIDHTATATVKIATCCTVTANGNTSSAASGTVNENAADPQIALDSGAVPEALRYFGIYSGAIGPSSLTLISGMTGVSDHDFGAFCGRVDRQIDFTSGSTTVGYTAGTDDVAMVGIAVKETGAMSVAPGAATLLVAPTAPTVTVAPVPTGGPGWYSSRGGWW